MEMINMLLIAQHFPPANNGGIGRPYSLYKYLPQHGINVFVITVNSYGCLKNEQNIFRCASFINWRAETFFSLVRITKIMSLFLTKTISMYTDLYWYHTAKKVARKLIREQKIDALYVTFPGIETLKLGYKISKKYKIPVITEFRDGLAFESVFGARNIFKKYQLRRVEQKVVQCSRVIITIGSNLSDFFVKKYPNACVQTVFNGFDVSDFIMADAITPPNKNKIAIGHFGSLDSSRCGDRKNLFIALQDLYQKQILREDNFVLSLIGRYSEDEKNRIWKYNTGNCIKFQNLMPKKEGLAYVKANFDYLLFYGMPNGTTIISSKLLEYLRIGMPIIGICKGNEASDIIEKTGTGEVCDFDVDSITHLFLKIIQQKRIRFNPNPEEIAKFDRKYQAGQIARIIKDVTNNKNKFN
jgi:glycosyltransferase involved in cell wall biosynthesis